MISKTKRISFGLFIVGNLMVVNILAQDVNLSDLSKVDPFKVSGGVSMSNRFYFANGIEDRQDPYIWTLSGQINFSIYGIAVPLSAIITSQNTSYTQPYNRISIRPTYKWAKLYLGYSNMTYSDYTLAGHTFLGGGVELTPGKIRVAANYGRFASAVPFDLPTNQPFVPSFTRMGYGGKIGYGDDSNFIDFTFFQAKDEANSWDNIPDSTTVFPGENQVLGLAWRFSKVKNLTLAGEIARSAYTTDIRDQEINSEQLFKVFGFQERESTVKRNAMKLSASYKLGAHTVSSTYERIDPEYQTMGAYFFNNDMENITAAYATSFWKKRISLSLNGGFQRNNLHNTEISESVRTIASGNLVFSKSPFSVGVNFSNYSADVNYVLNPELDSLNAVVVTKSVAIFGNYLIQGNADQHIFTINLNRQGVTDDFVSSDRGGTNNSVISGTLGYTIKISSLKTDVSTRFNYNRNDLSGVITDRWGPGITAKKKFFQDKVNAQASLNYFSSEGNSTFSALLNGSMVLKSKHTIMLSVSMIQRTLTTMETEGVGSSKSSYGETISTINYAYRF